MEAYIATDGSVWHLSCDCPPIPSREFDWSATHDDYDGAPDAHDDRFVNGRDQHAVIVAVEQWIFDEAEEIPFGWGVRV